MISNGSGVMKTLQPKHFVQSVACKTPIHCNGCMILLRKKERNRMISKKALEGIRILDFSHVYQGPVGTQILADYGADVIKVERPGSGDWSRAWGPFVKDVSLPFANLNRNKRSITVDIKQEDGKEIICKLVKSSDVLVHNFRQGVMEKLGFGYDDLKEINPSLIYAASSGWGDTGPYADRGRAGHDMTNPTMTSHHPTAGGHQEMGSGRCMSRNSCNGSGTLGMSGDSCDSGHPGMVGTSAIP